jgi:hypothetical protein
VGEPLVSIDAELGDDRSVVGVALGERGGRLTGVDPPVLPPRDALLHPVVPEGGLARLWLVVAEDILEPPRLDPGQGGLLLGAEPDLAKEALGVARRLGPELRSSSQPTGTARARGGCPLYAFSPRKAAG